MTAIGETLHRERLRRNLDLETVSRELKISAKFLEAIEQEKFDRLPGGVFAKSFVRQYAHLLGLDEEEMASEVQRQLHPAADVPQFAEAVRPDSTPIALPRVEAWQTVGDRRFEWSSSLPALALVVVVMMSCAGVYSWWQRTRHTVSAHEKAPVPVASVAQPAASQAAPDAAPNQTPPAPVQAAAAEQPQVSRAADVTIAPPPEPAAPSKEQATPAPAVAATSVPNPPPNPNASVRVELVASEPVWVLAKTDGKYLFSGTIEPNQIKNVDANSSVMLRIGNAGGVSITLNGKSIGSVGPKGQVRTVQLTSGGFEIVAAPKPPSAPLEDPRL